MQNYLFITIDAEEDLWGSYETTNPPVENISRLPILHEIFEKYSAVPTYLINYPVATNNSSVEILKKLYSEEKCDIGTHCHPWNTPPNEESLTNYNSFLCNLSENLIYLKLANLHNKILENFEIKPIVFRAGRWGFNEKVAKIIQQLGYKIDTSITPFSDWEEYSGPYLGLSRNTAYGFNEIESLCLKAENCSDCEMCGSCILEIPPTIGFLQRNFKICNNVRNFFKTKIFMKFKLLAVLDKLRILNYRWLSPEFSSYNDMVKLTIAVLRNSHQFLNMSFHSTSLLPGKSPFIKDKNDLNFFLLKIERYLKFASEMNISCIGMSTALKLLL